MKRLAALLIVIILCTTLVACSISGRKPWQATLTALATPAEINETPQLAVTQTPEPMHTTQPTAIQTAEPTYTAQPSQTLSAEPRYMELLKSFTFQVPDFNLQVSLVNGSFDNGEIRSQLIEPAAFGDLDGDGKTDAAVILTVDPSGSGTFYYLTTVIDLDGSPSQAGSVYIGDRQGINNLAIVDGRIILDYITQGLNDPLCCPSEHRMRTYILEDKKLKLASEQIIGVTPENIPLPVMILIDQPAMGDLLTNPLHVSGRISRVPPGQTLTYYLTDSSATLLDQGEVLVEGQPGSAGTFAFDLKLEAASPGVFQLEVVDSADGLLLGRTVVMLITK